MQGRSLQQIVCTSTELLFVSISMFLCADAFINVSFNASVEAFPKQIQLDQNSKSISIDGQAELQKQSVQKLATAVTVRILNLNSSGNAITSGSGVIIQKQGNVYTLLTNLHVLQFADRYMIVTHDGLQYKPLLLSRSVQFGFGSNDMAIAQFQSSQQYEIAQIKTEPLQIGDRVFAAGFPIYQAHSLISTLNLGMQAFHFTEGRISILPAKSLAQGYQIGYSNDIVVGMSGGPIFDVSGFLIGINGRTKNRDPDFGGYTFSDGTEPSLMLLQQMLNASWGVPISTYLHFNSIRLNNSFRS